MIQINTCIDLGQLGETGEMGILIVEVLLEFDKGGMPIFIGLEVR